MDDRSQRKRKIHGDGRAPRQSRRVTPAEERRSERRRQNEQWREGRVCVREKGRERLIYRYGWDRCGI